MLREFYNAFLQLKEKGNPLEKGTNDRKASHRRGNINGQEKEVKMLSFLDNERKTR